MGYKKERRRCTALPMSPTQSTGEPPPWAHFLRQGERAASACAATQRQELTDVEGASVKEAYAALLEAVTNLEREAETITFANETEARQYADEVRCLFEKLLCGEK